MDLYQPGICNPPWTSLRRDAEILPCAHSLLLFCPKYISMIHGLHGKLQLPGVTKILLACPVTEVCDPCLRLLLHCFQSGLPQYHLCNTYRTGQCISIPFLSWDCSWVNMAWLERVQKLHLLADEDLLCFELLTVSLFDATPKGRELHKTEKVRAPYLIHIGTHRVCLLSILIR